MHRVWQPNWAALVFGAGLALMSASVACAQLLTDTLRPPEPTDIADSANPQAFRDWTVDCTNDATGCTMSPAASAYEGTNGVRRLFGRLIEVAARSGPVPVFVVEITLDYLLPEGVKVKVDGRSYGTLAVRSCHQGGCLVPFRLEPGLLAAFRRGYTLELTLTSLDGATESVEISLLGFTRAFQAMQDG
jgi:invasion protein IalB